MHEGHESVYEEALEPEVKIWEAGTSHDGREYREVPIRSRTTGRIVRKLVFWGSGHTGRKSRPRG